MVSHKTFGNMVCQEIRTKSSLASGSFSWESVIPDPSTESLQKFSTRKLIIDGESGKEFTFETLGYFNFDSAQRKVKLALCLHQPGKVKNVCT